MGSARCSARCSRHGGRSVPLGARCARSEPAVPAVPVSEEPSALFCPELVGKLRLLPLLPLGSQCPGSALHSPGSAFLTHVTSWFKTLLQMPLTALLEG